MATIPSAHFAATPLYMQALIGDPAINYTAKDFRHLHEAIWATPGVITPTSFRVEQAETLGWSVRIRPGIAVVGGYLVYQPEAITLNVAALNTNPVGTRYHRVYLVVQDKAESGNADGYYAQLKVVEDFGAGAPTPEAVAVLLLATFTISPGQNNIQTGHIAAKPRKASTAGDYVMLDDLAATGVASGSTSNDSPPARVRYDHGQVRLSGSFKKITGSFAAGATTLATLPVYLRPTYTVWALCGTSDPTNSYYRLKVEPTGEMTAYVPAAGTPSYLYLDGASYEID